ncbi:MAG: hypothetical protein ACRDH5_16950 [bacterium]
MRAPWNLLVRDLALAAATLALWLLSRRLDASASAAAVPVAVLAGLALPGVGFLAHEWGHLAGARLAGSVIDYPASLRSPFLFHFDGARNGRRQFLWLSAGGFVASAVFLGGLLAGLSLNHLADRIALGLAAIGVLATLVLEVPQAWRVYRGASLPAAP